MLGLSLSVNRFLDSLLTETFRSECFRAAIRPVQGWLGNSEGPQPAGFASTHTLKHTSNYRQMEKGIAQGFSP